MTLFSYPSTAEAYANAKTHEITVDAGHEGSVQFTLERGSRGIKPGQSIRVTDYELSLIKPSLFDDGVLTKRRLGSTVGAADSGVSTQTFDLDLADIADGVVASFEAAFDGLLVGWEFITTVPATTAAKTTTLTPEIEGDPVQGTGDATLTITTATADTKGELITGELPATDNAFVEGDTIDIVASATTAFVEGAGVLRLTLVET